MSIDAVRHPTTSLEKVYDLSSNAAATSTVLFDQVVGTCVKSDCIGLDFWSHAISLNPNALTATLRFCSGRRMRPSAVRSTVFVTRPGAQLVVGWPVEVAFCTSRPERHSGQINRDLNIERITFPCHQASCW